VSRLLDPLPRKCPHGAMHHCPLYVAAHVAHVPTCFDGNERGCSVDRGASYDRIFGRITRRQWAVMHGFTMRSIIGDGNAGLRRIWPWMFASKQLGRGV
jgi:hypothetical protein